MVVPDHIVKRDLRIQGFKATTSDEANQFLKLIKIGYKNFSPHLLSLPFQPQCSGIITHAYLGTITRYTVFFFNILYIRL